MSTNDLTTREWTEAGREFTAEPFRVALEAAVADLTWQEPINGNIGGAMSPVMSLQAAVEGFELWGTVLRYAIGGGLRYPDGPETATYTLLGLEYHEPSFTAQLLMLDVAGAVIPLYVDTTPLD
jgi:hypothetical protein